MDFTVSQHSNRSQKSNKKTQKPEFVEGQYKGMYTILERHSTFSHIVLMQHIEQLTTKLKTPSKVVIH